jgi:hypothetical protein
MKSPYRPGTQVTVSNAAVQAAAAIVGAGYRGIDGNTPSRIVNLASAIVDEIEARKSAEPVIVPEGTNIDPASFNRISEAA